MKNKNQAHLPCVPWETEKRQWFKKSFLMKLTESLKKKIQVSSGFSEVIRGGSKRLGSPPSKQPDNTSRTLSKYTEKLNSSGAKRFGQSGRFSQVNHKNITKRVCCTVVAAGGQRHGGVCRCRLSFLSVPLCPAPSSPSRPATPCPAS